jgi:SAM-dependent methyltransferase
LSERRRRRVKTVPQPRTHAKSAVIDTYRRHPLCEQSLLSRIRAAGLDTTVLTETDLAVDSETEITDQNHIGGLPSVIALARAATITTTDSVLDLGAGLGGSARVLASYFGCHVDGIDLSPERCREGARLTRLVGLDHLVRLRCADMENARATPATYSVLWGQSSWVHVSNRQRFVSRWTKALKHEGRIAMEDAFLEMASPPRSEAARLLRLETQWKSYLAPLTEWLDLFAADSFSPTTIVDLTQEMVQHFRRLERASRRMPVASDEVAGWRDAIRLAEHGVLTYRRVVARCTSAS